MQDYARFHTNKTNLLLHIVMVPLFSIAVQGAGHKQEPNPPLPFDGPGDFVKRIFSEQFYKFPQFLLTGEWLRAIRASR